MVRSNQLSAFVADQSLKADVLLSEDIPVPSSWIIRSTVSLTRNRPLVLRRVRVPVVLDWIVQRLRGSAVDEPLEGAVRRGLFNDWNII